MASAPDPELLAVYRTEAVETVETVHAHLLRIEEGAPDRDARLEDVLRLAHDIKGSARVVGYELVGHLAHALEGCLVRWRGRADVPRAWADLAFRASDHIRALSLEPDGAEQQARAHELLAELRGAPAGPAPARPPEPRGEPLPETIRPAPAQSLRVSRESVDAVSDDVAVTLMDALAVAERLDALARALDALDVPPAHEGATASESHARDELVGGLRRAREKHRALAEALRQLDGHARELDERARALRLTPAEPLFTHVERVARDTAAALGREVRVESSGRELLIDVLLLEALKGPLTHAVRNALDHGLEPPEARRAAGKPAAGLLRFALSDEGDTLRVEVADDGRGVDLAAARRKLGAVAGALDDSGVLDALLRAGVSTRDSVSSISGRGLGLGAMAALADRLRGESRLLSSAGAGTRLVALLPRQLSLIDAVVVSSCGLLFALPAGGLLELGPADPAAPPLAGVLGLPGATAPATDGRVLRLRAGTAEARVSVDAAVRTLRLVRRPLPAHLGELPCAQGASILPGGEPVLLLDPRAVAEACRGAPRAPVARCRLLLADDSATLRARLHAGLADAGYEVVAVADGQAALEHLGMQAFDAVVSDVQMPRRDGFAVAARCAGRTPCVLMTAQPSADGATRAGAHGARYVGKDESLVTRLLSELRELLTASVETKP